MTEILAPATTSAEERLDAIAKGITPSERAAGTQHLASVIMPAFRAWCERHDGKAGEE